MIVRYFARFREAAGKEKEVIEIGPHSTVSRAMETIRMMHPWLAKEQNVLIAVNATYAKPDDRISDSDELAIFPAVSGG